MSELKVGNLCIHRAVTPETFTGSDWIYRTELREVRLMAIAGKWAMVRRPRCIPYVTELKKLEPLSANQQAAQAGE